MNLRVSLALLSVPLLVLLYWLLKPPAAVDHLPSPSAAVPTVAPSPPPATSAPAPFPAPTTILRWRVAGGRLLESPQSLTLQQGETVTLRITSDVADTVHIHGYDVTARIAPGATVELGLVAAHSGRFEIELHHSGLALGALQVLPR